MWGVDFLVRLCYFTGMKKFIIFLTTIILVFVGIGLNTFGVVFATEVQTDIDDGLPELYIKAVNPGYTVDKIQNVGEMIEIGRRKSDTSISLAGLSLGYTNTSGKTTTIVDFSKYIWTAGETILLRLASSPDSELANLQYSTTLALKAGPLELIQDGKVIDSVCWTGKNDCQKEFSSSNPTYLVRDPLTNEFGHVSNYEFSFTKENLVTQKEENPVEDEVKEQASQCKGMEFSEILSYYESLQSEQFIELHNASSENINLDGCYLKYKNKNYPLGGMVAADEYMVRYLDDFKLTKNPTNSNTIELVESDGTVVDSLEYFNGQRKGAAYALIGYDESGKEIWKITFAPTPGEPNNYQEFRTCEAGKVINEATGNCVKVTSVAEKVCGEGQYLNILTGRCKKIATDSSSKECKEGYYYYEETGRCRKIQENTGADYALVPETYKEESSFVALYLILGVVAVGLVYVIYEFRHEIARVLRKIKR